MEIMCYKAIKPVSSIYLCADVRNNEENRIDQALDGGTGWVQQQVRDGRCQAPRARQRVQARGGGRIQVRDGRRRCETVGMANKFSRSCNTSVFNSLFARKEGSPLE